MADQWTPVDDAPAAGGWTPVPEATTAAAPSGWTPVDDSSKADSGWEPYILGGAGLLAGAGILAATHNPDAAMEGGSTLAKGVGKGIDTLLDVRRASMLSGFAPLKSLLGNIGGTAYESIERGSMEPLKQLFSSQTLKDAAQIYKEGPNYAAAGPANLQKGLSDIPYLKYIHPGRIMGTLDQATQNALMRAGLTDKEAATTMLQAPLDSKWSKAFNNRVMNYELPFRRIPINQFLEGAKTFGADTAGQRIALGTSLATGAATGATAEDPKTIAFGTAASGRYGLPFTLGAVIGRGLSSGSKATGIEAARGLSPISDYSLGEGAIGPFVDPTSVIPPPAALTAWGYLKSLIGMGN